MVSLDVETLVNVPSMTHASVSQDTLIISVTRHVSR